MAEPLEETITTVIEFVQLASDRGQGSGMLSLRRQLEALLEEPRPRYRPRASQAGITFEYEAWCRAIDLLSPKVREAVLAHLRSTSRVRSALEDPWMALDSQAVAERNERVAKRAADAQQAAVQACGSYGARGSIRYLRDAMNELIAAVRYGREQRFRIPDEESCPALAERLYAALSASLEPSALHFFARYVREDIAAHTPVARDGGKRRWSARAVEDQWLSERRRAEPGFNEEPVAGRWFVAWLQADYDETVKAAKARKRAREQQAKRERKEAAERARMTERADRSSGQMPPGQEPVHDPITDRRRREGVLSDKGRLQLRLQQVLHEYVMATHANAKAGGGDLGADRPLLGDRAESSSGAAGRVGTGRPARAQGLGQLLSTANLARPH